MGGLRLLFPFLSELFECMSCLCFADRLVNGLEVRRHVLVILVGHVTQAVTHHVNDAQLNLSVGVFGVDRFREALQPIDTGNQDVLDPASLELGQDRQPELRALVFSQPEP